MPGMRVVFVDFLEDRVRSRGLGVLLLTVMFLLVTGSLVVLVDRPDTTPNAMVFASTQPNSAFLRQPLTRDPRVQLLSSIEVGVEGRTVSASITKMSPFSSHVTVDCSSDYMASVANTVEELRVRDACAVELAGTTATSDAVGVAHLANLRFVRGPPGTYDVRYGIDGDSAVAVSAQLGVFSNVAGLKPIDSKGAFAPAPKSITIGEAIQIDGAGLRVLVSDSAHAPIEGAVVTMLVWDSPRFSKAGNAPPILNNRLGQQFGVLRNAKSAPSGKDGVAAFTDVAVTASTSSLIWLAFYCEGATFAWSNPNEAIATVQLPEPPKLLVPTAVSTTVSAVAVTQAPPTSAVEGTPLSTQPTVKVTDSTGAGVAGKTVVAIVVQGAGKYLPLRNRGTHFRQNYKMLQWAVSQPTAADGSVTFEKLTFGVRGDVGLYRIVFVCDGVASDVPEQGIDVSTSVVDIKVSSVPSAIRFAAGNRAGNEYSIKISSAVAVVRAVNENGEGVPGKMIRGVVLDQDGEWLDYSTQALGGTPSVDLLVPETTTLRLHTGPDGFADVPVLMAYVMDNDAVKEGVTLMFACDGMWSAPSGRTNIDFDSAPDNRTAVYISTEKPPVQSLDISDFTKLQGVYRALNYQGKGLPGVVVGLLHDDRGPFEAHNYQHLDNFFTMNGIDAAVAGVTDANGYVTLGGYVVRAPTGNATLSLTAVSGQLDGDVWDASAPDTFPDAITSIDALGDFTDIMVHMPIATISVNGKSSTTGSQIDLGELDPTANKGLLKVQYTAASPAGVGLQGVSATPLMTQTPINLKLAEYSQSEAAFKGGVSVDLGAGSTTVDVQYFSETAVTDEGSFFNSWFGMLENSNGANSAGVSDVYVRAGSPGSFTFILDVYGVRSPPLTFRVPSKLASIEIVRQPEAVAFTPPSSFFGLARVGNLLETQPRVRVKDATGGVLQGYRISAVAVNDDGSTAPAMLDLAKDSVTNVFDTRVSDPSNALGAAQFQQIGFLDGFTGCYRLAFTFNDGTNPAVWSQLSDPLCIINADTYSLVRSPSATTSVGSRFPTAAQVRHSRPYISDLGDFHVQFMLVDAYRANVRSEGDQGLAGVVEAAAETAELIKSAGAAAQFQALAGILGSTGTVFEGNVVTGGDAVQSWQRTPFFVSGVACLFIGGSSVNAQGKKSQVCSLTDKLRSGENDLGAGVTRETTVGFDSLTWDAAIPGDRMTLRAYSPLILGAEQSKYFQTIRSPTVSGGCAGPTSGGVLGQCCDSDAQCGGGGTICDTATRTCSKACTADADCATTPEPSTGKGSCNTATGKCRASSVVDWSFLPYCTQCKGNIKVTLPGVSQSVTSSATAGPPSLFTSGVFAQLFTTIDKVCGIDDDVAETCVSNINGIISFVTKVVNVCSSKAGAFDACNGGFSERALTISLVNALVGTKEAGSDTGKQEEAVIDAMRTLFKSTPVKGPGRSEATSVLQISALPAQLFVDTQPPESVAINDVFEVTVLLTIATGAPLSGATVTANIARELSASAPVDVKSFLDQVQSSVAAQKDPWAQPQLEAARNSAVTDSKGIARFRLRVTSAPSGKYTFTFNVGQVKSPATTPVFVTNEVSSTELGGDGTVDPTAKIPTTPFRLVAEDKFPASFQPFVPTVKAKDANGEVVPNVSATAYVLVAHVNPDGSPLVAPPTSFEDLTASEALMTVFRLLMQGSRKFQFAPTPAANAAVDLGPGVKNPDGSWSFPKFKVSASTAGNVQVVLAVDGIGTRRSAVIEFVTPEEDAALQQLTAFLIKVGLFLAFGIVLLGNSGWQHKVFIASSFLIIAVAISVMPIVVAKSSKSSDAAETLTVVLYILLGSGAAWMAYVGVLEALNKTTLLFPNIKRRAYFNYVRAIWSRPDRVALAIAGAESGQSHARSALDATRVCGVCESAAATMTCLSCDDTLCAPCGHIIHRGRLAKHHTVIAGTGAATLRLGHIAEVGTHELQARRTAVQQASSERSGSKAHLRAALASFFKRDRSDAFFYPSKMLGAFFISILAVITLLFLTLDYMVSAQSSVASADARALRTIFSGVSSLEDLFYRTFGVDMATHETEYAYDQAYRLHDEFVSLSNAFIGTSVVAMILAILSFFLAWLVLLVDFRQQVFDARRGEYSFERTKVRLADSANYMGIQISNGMMTFLFMVFIITLVIFPFAWNRSRDWFFSQWALWLSLGLPSLVNVVIKKVWGYGLATGQAPYEHIKRRACYNAYDLYQTFMQLYTGIVTAIARLGIVIAVNLFTLPRLDRSPMPAWIERYLLLDSGSKSYQAMIKAYANFNNPIARTAAWIIERDSAKRAAGADLQEDEDEEEAGPRAPGKVVGRVAPPKTRSTSAHWRASLRWQMAVLLLRNPSLRQYRCHLTKAQIAAREQERDQSAASKAKKAPLATKGSAGSGAGRGDPADTSVANPLRPARVGRDAKEAAVELSGFRGPATRPGDRKK